MSKKQYAVLVAAVDERRTYKEIAAEAGLSVSTVRSHLHAVYSAFGVVGRGQAILHAYRNGWLEPDFSQVDRELRILWRLADVIEKLALALNRRRTSFLSRAQRTYLEEFSDLLRARGEDEEDAAHASVAHALGKVLEEAGLERCSRREDQALDLLVGVARAFGEQR